MAPTLATDDYTYAYEGETYYDFKDSEVGPSITPFGRDADGDPIVSLAVPGADPSWVLDPYVESANSAEYINGGGLADDIRATQNMGAAGTAAYAAILFGGPFIVEGLILAGGAASSASAAIAARAMPFALAEAELFSMSMSSSPAFAAAAYGLMVLGEAESVATGLPPTISGVGAGGARSSYDDLAHVLDGSADEYDDVVPLFDDAADAVEGLPPGKPYGARRPKVLRDYLNRRGVELHVGDQFLAPGQGGGFALYPDGSAAMILPNNPTEYVVTHELAHFVHWRKLGSDAYRALPRTATWNAAEQFVFDQLEHPRRWKRLNEAEKRHAVEYIERVGFR